MLLLYEVAMQHIKKKRISTFKTAGKRNDHVYLELHVESIRTWLSQIMHKGKIQSLIPSQMSIQFSAYFARSDLCNQKNALKQIITCILRKAHGLLQVLTSCVMMPCSNKPIRMLMDLSLVFLNSVMFLFVKFSSAVQRYCCSRCTLLNFFLLTHSRKCVNLYIMNIDTRLTC